MWLGRHRPGEMPSREHSTNHRWGANLVLCTEGFKASRRPIHHGFGFVIHLGNISGGHIGDLDTLAISEYQCFADHDRRFTGGAPISMMFFLGHRLVMEIHWRFTNLGNTGGHPMVRRCHSEGYNR
ncbi:hypothetical protein HAX54_017800 [Datura stramonium]|uniref:Uncharacterized protein n=1 Tax=Datura stramonium TaxID=4076 RepID=A0ABS8ULB7_DATST|nr:hypothetical protein [Datura stramonium]